MQDDSELPHHTEPEDQPAEVTFPWCPGAEFLTQDDAVEPEASAEVHQTARSRPPPLFFCFASHL